MSRCKALGESLLGEAQSFQSGLPLSLWPSSYQSKLRSSKIVVEKFSKRSATYSQTNNTAVFDVHNQCYTDAGANYTRPNSTAAECFSFYGGAFNESRSSTWTNAGSYGALGVPEDSIVDFGPIAYVTDTLSLISIISTPRFPFVIDHGRTGYEAFFMNTVGLGINSTLLNTLISARKIPTRTWSMFNGFTGSQSQNQSNGILVLGGYDEAKIFGSVADNITIDMDFSPDAISSTNLAKCPATGMIITVSNMTLAWPNGTKASLMGSSAGDTLRGCVIPNYDYISMQSDMWETFVSLTDTQEVGRSNSPLSWFQNLVTAESAYVTFLSINKCSQPIADLELIAETVSEEI